jgi:hypothetical protein
MVSIAYLLSWHSGPKSVQYCLEAELNQKWHTHPPPASPPDPHPRALAASRNACTEALMLAHGFSIDMMVELIDAGLASAHADRMHPGG